jgi:hypothetical protein
MFSLFFITLSEEEYHFTRQQSSIFLNHSLHVYFHYCGLTQLLLLYYFILRLNLFLLIVLEFIQIVLRRLVLTLFLCIVR